MNPNHDRHPRQDEETRRRGVLIGKGGLHGNVIRIGPPLVATTSDIDELVTALDAAFATV